MRKHCAEELKQLAQMQKNVGVEETNPQRPHFVVAEKNSGVGAGDRCDCDGEIAELIDMALLNASFSL